MTTFLEKGAKDNGRSDNALRTVRAKREADEAGMYAVCLIITYAERGPVLHSLDKEYRKGVHWLETLRLRRIKILESGYQVRIPLFCTMGRN